VLARQRWAWNQPHPETSAARRWALVELPVLAVCGAVLLGSGPWRAYVALGAGAAAFGSLAVWINLHNRQRAEWFQITSALALTASSLVACLAVRRGIPAWAWTLWLLNALQATTAIFVVHARLDARIAQRKRESAPPENRRAAIASIAALLAAALVFAARRSPWITAALLLASAGYAFELRRQRDARCLQTPLTRIGIESLGLAMLYGAMLIAGLWQAT